MGNRKEQLSMPNAQCPMPNSQFPIPKQSLQDIAAAIAKKIVKLTKEIKIKAS
ncbi:MAG: hypothetical protein V7K98_24260 [Nostoc sp.]|uniref:hypothetical protein n=1 Tax=Nostoc sp. TaxID=1180 RepID=UPI002FFB982E